MTPVHAIMVLIIRLWASWIFIHALLATPFYFSAFLDNDVAPSAASVAWLINYIVGVIIGVAGWRLAPKLARLVYKPQGQSDNQVNVDAETLVAAGGFLIGSYYLVQYVPQLIGQVGAMMIENSKQDPAAPYELGNLRSQSVNFRQLATDIMVIAAASFMAFRPCYLARVFSWLRSAGQYEAQRTPREGEAG